MSGRHPQSIEVSDRHRPFLARWASRQTGDYRVVLRAKILLAAVEPSSHNEQIARRFGVKARAVARWRTRWMAHARHLDDLEATLRIEGKSEARIERALERALEEGLSDAPRSGTPAKFTSEQIVAIACEDLRNTADRSLTGPRVSWPTKPSYRKSCPRSPRGAWGVF